jgi:hypothetical protein
VEQVSDLAIGYEVCFRPFGNRIWKLRLPPRNAVVRIASKQPKLHPTRHTSHQATTQTSSQSNMIMPNNQQHDHAHAHQRQPKNKPREPADKQHQLLLQWHKTKNNY